MWWSSCRRTTPPTTTSVRCGPGGANVAADWPTQPNPPAKDQPHNRAAYAKWLHAQQAGSATPATHTQFDTTTVLPYYAYLAATGAFLDNHCSGYGTNSTPNHLLIVGGQTPTLRNPPRSQPAPVWDMPSLLGHAGDHGLTWKAYTGSSSYPVAFYQQLAGSPNIVRSDRILADAAGLPQLSMVWHDSPYDEHPVADVTRGQDKIWQAVDAIVTAGHWDDTVFLLTWDDWGGFGDHVATPNVEHTPDGVQLAYGPASRSCSSADGSSPASTVAGTRTCPSGAPYSTYSASRRWASTASTTPPPSPTSSPAHRRPRRRPPTARRSASRHRQHPPPARGRCPHPQQRRQRRSARSCCATAPPCRPQTISRSVNQGPGS